jgi:cell division protein FtsX
MALQKIKAINIASSLKIFNLSSGKSQTEEVSPLHSNPFPSLVSLTVASTHDYPGMNHD